MKHLIILIALLTITTDTFSQSQTLDSLTRHRELREGDLKLNVPGWLLRMGLKIAANDADSEAARTMKALRHGIGKAQITVLENTKVSTHTMNRILSEIRDNGYEDYLQVREGSEYVNIMVQEKDEMIRRMLITVHEGEGQFVSIKLKTKFTLDELATLINEASSY